MRWSYPHLYLLKTWPIWCSEWIAFGICKACCPQSLHGTWSGVRLLPGQCGDRSPLPLSCLQAFEHPELLDRRLRCALEGQSVDCLHSYVWKLRLPVPACGLHACPHQQTRAGASLLLETAAGKLATLQHHALWKRYIAVRRGGSAAQGEEIRQSCLSEMQHWTLQLGILGNFQPEHVQHAVSKTQRPRENGAHCGLLAMVLALGLHPLANSVWKG